MAFFGMGGGMAAYAEEQKKRGRKTVCTALQRAVLTARSRRVHHP